MIQGAEAANLSAMREGELQQAEYFWRLLDGRKFEVCERLEAELEALARFQRAGDLSGVRHHQRFVKTLQSELRAVDRMLLALRIRLGLPTLQTVFVTPT